MDLTPDPADPGPVPDLDLGDPGFGAERVFRLTSTADRYAGILAVDVLELVDGGPETAVLAINPDTHTGGFITLDRSAAAALGAALAGWAARSGGDVA